MKRALERYARTVLAPRAPFTPRRSSGRWLVSSATQGSPCPDRRATALHVISARRSRTAQGPSLQPRRCVRHPFAPLFACHGDQGAELLSQGLCSPGEGAPSRSHGLGDSARWSSGSCLCEQACGSIPQVACQTARGGALSGVCRCRRTSSLTLQSVLSVRGFALI